MKISPRDILNTVLIGFKVEVSDSTDPTLKGLKGRVIDETYNMLYVETEKGVRKIIKSTCQFIFTLPDGRRVVVDGSRIVGRPEDRIKRERPRRW